MNNSNDANRVFKGILNSGVEYELFAVQGFSNYAEVALKISGRIVSVITIDTRRTGNIVCRPAISIKEILIKRSEGDSKESNREDEPPEAYEPLDLSDVLSDRDFAAPEEEIDDSIEIADEDNK